MRIWRQLANRGTKLVVCPYNAFLVSDKSPTVERLASHEWAKKLGLDLAVPPVVADTRQPGVILAGANHERVVATGLHAKMWPSKDALEQGHACGTNAIEGLPRVWRD